MNLVLRTLSPLLCGALAASASAQTCPVTVDINAVGSGYSSSPDGEIQAPLDNQEYTFLQLGAHWFFSADSLATGEELYRTDGTAAGTALVKDINPGAGDAKISDMAVHGGLLWFSADDGVHGSELWVSDGTAAGTTLVRDINAGSGGSSIDAITGLGGKVYFAANDQSLGAELWSSDGTAAGTQFVADVNPGFSSSSPSDLVQDSTGTKLLFRAREDFLGTELWITDGTAAGTTLVKDIRPGSDSSSPDHLVPHNGEVFFKANDGTHGIELWKTDGTPAGTVMVLDSNPGSPSGNPSLTYSASLGGDLIYRATGSNGSELWKTDGTAAGTVEVKDIHPTGGSNPQDFVLHGGKVYFSADDNSVFGRELWVTDGTTAGTVLVHDFAPGLDDGLSFNNNNLTSHNGDLYLTAGISPFDKELWKTDGTFAGTSLVKDIEGGGGSSNPDWLTPISPTLLMFTADTDALGEELYVTDGTAPGTTLLVEIEDAVITDDSNPNNMHPVGGDFVLFVADDGVTGEELYRWDAATGATLLKDINPGADDSDAYAFYTCFLGGQLVTFFRADDGTNGAELWITDGTAAGTSMLADIHPGGGASSPIEFFFHPLHQALYFQADDGVTGAELWRTDGTTAGTTLVADINVGASGSFPAGIIDNGLAMVFRANDGANGIELFASYGTGPSTTLVMDIFPGTDPFFGPNSSNPKDFFHIGGKLVFVAGNDVVGQELWTTDGTAAGTSVVVDLWPGDDGAGYSHMTWFQDEVYFQGNNGVSGYELYKTDGTAAGTVLVADLVPGIGSGSPSDMSVSGGKLFFKGNDSGVTGGELWTSDGTAAGTTLVIDLRPGSSSSAPRYLTPVSDGVYFRAHDGVTGYELWFSDGTAAGTTQVCDIFPGPTSSSPTEFVLCAGDLFFKADDPAIGKELFTVPAVGAYSEDLGLGFWGGPRLSSSAPVLGGSITFEGRDAQPGVAGLLVMSGHVGTPSTLLVDALSVNWLDVGTASIQGLVLTPSWTITKSIPAIPTLAGVQLNLQAWYLPGGTLPAQTSNGLHLVVGS